MKYIGFIVRNLFKSQATSNVFIIRQFIASGGTHSCVYRGRRPGWLHVYEKTYHNMLIAIKKGHLCNAALCIRTLLKTKSPEELHNVLTKYYYDCSHYGCSANVISIDKIESLWNTRTHPDDFHCLIALIVHMAGPDERIHSRNIFISPTDKEIDDVVSLNNENIMENARKDFQAKRLYPIHHLIGSFSLARTQLHDFKTASWYHWEYYAYKSPIWRERIETLSGIVDHENRTVAFPDDAFYDKYGYEFDEQSKKVQDMSLIEVSSGDWRTWYDSVFGGKGEDAPIILLPEGFKYMY